MQRASVEQSKTTNRNTLAPCQQMRVPIHQIRDVLAERRQIGRELHVCLTVE